MHFKMIFSIKKYKYNITKSQHIKKVTYDKSQVPQALLESLLRDGKLCTCVHDIIFKIFLI